MNNDLSMLPSANGEAAGFSIRRRGFDPRWECQFRSIIAPMVELADTPVSESGAVNGMQVQILLGVPLFLGSRLAVGRLALTQATGVRRPASQPNLQHGCVTQLVEYRPFKPGVAGSTPTAPTIFVNNRKEIPVK